MGCCESSNVILRKSTPRFEVLELNSQSSVTKNTFVNHTKGNIRERFEIIKALGKGGFGTVYLVNDLGINELRAMKQLHKSRLNDHESIKLLQQVELLKSLDHPYIMKVYQLVQSRTCFYVITQLLEGGQLFDQIVKYKHLTEKSAADYMKYLMKALSYIHSKKIVHRDLKPENLVFVQDSPNSPLKLIDFGVSSRINNKEKLTDTIGTLLYMAPEVFKKSYDEKCDIWSSGVILYIMLSGHPPFYSNNTQELIQKIKEARPTFSESGWENISQAAKKLIIRMLDRNPRKRPSAIQILNSEWINGLSEEQSNIQQQGSLLANLESFHSHSQLEKSVMLFISSQISNSKEETELSQLFMKLDMNQNGSLTVEEIKLGISQMEGVSDIDVEAIVKEIDLSETGQIQYSEFLTVTRNWKKLFQEKELEKAFMKYDSGKDGFLSLKELRENIPGLPQTELDSFIAAADTDGDGKISFVEFKDYLLSKV